jgi:ubiquinone biosynthesis protein
MDLKTISNLGRFKDIVFTLMKFGFDDLVQRLDVPGAGLVKKIHKVDRELSTYQRIRHTLEELGPTFVKFGQIMSLRPDLLPQPLIQELSRLQDEVGPEDFTKIRKVIEESLDRPLETVFSAFDEQPLAAASLSQVHQAVLVEGGVAVAVKVQRPGIRHKIEMDLGILAAIAERIHERSEELQAYDLPNLVRVTRRNLLRELDFTREARNMRIARSYASDDSAVYIPRVYEDYCSEHLLVMEYIEGTKLKDMDRATLQEPAALARQGLEAAIKQILEDGFFHADPHPGNMLIMNEKRLCLLDWGMVGRLSETDRYELIDLMKSVVEKDSRALLNALLRVANWEAGIDRRGLERELLDLLDSFYATPIGDLNLGQLLLDMTTLVREHRLRLQPDLVLMVKALMTAEGTARLIYPELDVISEAKRSVKQVAARRLEPKAILRHLRASLSDLLALSRLLPARLSEIVDKLDRGDLSVRFEHENLGGLRNTLESVSNRLTFGIIIAALIIGSSMIITTGVKPLLWGFPALGIIGYMISGVLGLWLIFTIIRTRRY